MTEDVLHGRADLAQPFEAYREELRSDLVDDALLDGCEALVRSRIRGEPVPVVPADERARAVLTFAEQFVIDPHGIDDAMRDAVLDHLTTPQLAVLVQWIALSDGLARLELMLDERGEERR
jgi:alkylhydroperoxidase family enzyme